MKGNSLGGRTIGRRRFLAESSIALVGASTGLGAFGRTALGESQFIEVETSCGRVRGAQADGLVTFKGIPYAGSVSGRNRFKAGPPLQPWTGVREALQLGAPSMQPNQNRPNEPPPAEDCLFLNVWTPAADGRKRPVMFYSHGGGFTTGSAGAAYQDGEQPCAHVGRRRRRDEPQARSHGLLVPWPLGRGGIRHVGQPGPAWISATG